MVVGSLLLAFAHRRLSETKRSSGASSPSRSASVLNSLTELFPTALRSDAFSWSNNLLGRLA
jgi:hypothetical protein